MEGGVIGLEDVSMIPKITSALMENGFSEEDLSKIWSKCCSRFSRGGESGAGPPEVIKIAIF